MSLGRRPSQEDDDSEGNRDVGEDGKGQTSPQSNAATSGLPTKEDADQDDIMS